MKFSSFILVLLLGSISQSYAFFGVSFGSCPKLPEIPNFNVSRYTGVWYEIERVANFFQVGLNCVTATYTQLNSTHISVKNAGFYSFLQNKTTTIEGYARVPDPTKPNQLLVKFPSSGEGSYNVWETDYNNYALVYSCSNLFRVVKIESIWILSRSKQLDQATVDRLKNVLASSGVKNTFQKTEQNCNN